MHNKPGRSATGLFGVGGQYRQPRPDIRVNGRGQRTALRSTVWAQANVRHPERVSLGCGSASRDASIGIQSGSAGLCSGRGA
jgi:hypothetical protein